MLWGWCWVLHPYKIHVHHISPPLYIRLQFLLLLHCNWDFQCRIQMKPPDNPLFLNHILTKQNQHMITYILPLRLKVCIGTLLTCELFIITTTGGCQLVFIDKFKIFMVVAAREISHKADGKGLESTPTGPIWGYLQN
ncbi:hypothetical protein V6Z12_D10G286000 [Gossypium hirsutum]